MLNPLSAQRPIRSQAAPQRQTQAPETDPVDSFAPGHRETFCEVAHALPAALHAPLDQTYATTKQFIKDHPFFHQGLMDLPIGGGKHFRNVPFIGPGRTIIGVVTLDRDEIAKGVETTRGTWDAE